LDDLEPGHGHILAYVLIYAAITSLDGFVADESGDFGWAAPDAEVHAFVNDLERPIGTHLYGRRMYEVMSAWETMDDDAPEMRDFAQIWRAADKVVYSRTLPAPVTARTRLEREFDPDAVLRMKAEAGADISIGGPELAGEALRAGLVDELHLFVTPVVVGGGTRWLPDDVRIDLELLDERRFSNGVVHLHHGVDLGPSRSSLG
jgi:dihydrofolate reductase